MKTLLPGSPKDFWEDTTVVLTITGPLIEIIASWISRWKRNAKSSKKRDAWVSNLKLAVGLFAGLALVKFTLLNRVDEQKSANEIASLQTQAQAANTQLISQGETLILQSQELRTTHGEVADVAQKAGTAVTKLNSEIAQASRSASIETLIGRMNADDALAYDQLVSMKEFDSPQQKDRVQQAVAAMIDVHNNPVYNGFNFKNSRGWFTATLPEMPERLRSKDPFEREQALRDVGPHGFQQNLFPEIVDLAINDPSLGVRTLAVRLIDAWGNQRFQPFRYDIRSWRDEDPSFQLPHVPARKP